MKKIIYKILIIIKSINYLSSEIESIGANYDTKKNTLLLVWRKEKK